MVCIGVLWNTVYTYKKEIIEDISNFGKIVKYYDLDLGVKYDDFVRNMYKSDGIANWKVELKIDSMKKSNDTRVILMFIKIDDLERRFNEKKEKEVIANIEDLKQYIRKKYSVRISNYFFDNIFHITDNEDELISTLLILKDWYNSIYVAYQNIDNSILKEKKLVLERKDNNSEN